ncbi:molybdopterin-dependent oxidoreductase [Marinobacterium marinum]|uniref:Molybdopterin-dependent oxidoreductase n=1 Tax=Marinobacterium marinum TaxID=2756129 RepID=A0A7W1WX34_9GAMM|nr:molybdopterin-dependent oxidoreductase [Marinobacterium marinum]MBA4501828.1 molybdopterin-dependent oxidoreductase [Marinobacterium marinum]
MHFLPCLSLSLLLVSSAAAQTDTLPQPVTPVILTVGGHIAHFNTDTSDRREARLDQTLLDTLPRRTLITSTVVTDGSRTFEGFLMRDLLNRLEAQGSTVAATALNDYVIRIPFDDFYRYDVLVADTMDGRRLTPRDKGPLWIVYPRDTHDELQDIRYDYRWVWQLHRLEIQ